MYICLFWQSCPSCEQALCSRLSSLGWGCLGFVALCIFIITLQHFHVNTTSKWSIPQQQLTHYELQPLLYHPTPPPIDFDKWKHYNNSNTMNYRGLTNKYAYTRPRTNELSSEGDYSPKRRIDYEPPGPYTPLDQRFYRYAGI